MNAYLKQLADAENITYYSATNIDFLKGIKAGINKSLETFKVASKMSKWEIAREMKLIKDIDAEIESIREKIENEQ